MDQIFHLPSDRQRRHMQQSGFQKVPGRVAQILQGLQSFRSPGVVPGDVPLEPTDTLLGVLALEGKAAAVLLDRGAFLQLEGEWCLVPYVAISVGMPPKEIPIAPLVLVTPQGQVDILPGTSDVWDVGRFFSRCAEDASAALSHSHAVLLEAK